LLYRKSSTRSGIVTIESSVVMKVVSVINEVSLFILIVDSPHNICSREPPFTVFLVPDSSHLSVVEKPD